MLVLDLANLGLQRLDQGQKRVLPLADCEQRKLLSPVNYQGYYLSLDIQNLIPYLISKAYCRALDKLPVQLSKHAPIASGSPF